MIRIVFLSEFLHLGICTSLEVARGEGYAYHKSSSPAWICNIPGFMVASPSSSASGSLTTGCSNFSSVTDSTIISSSSSSSSTEASLNWGSTVGWPPSSFPHSSSSAPPGNCLLTISSQVESYFLITSSSCTAVWTSSQVGPILAIGVG